MGIIRLVTAPLRSARTYARWVYLILGGALYLPFLLAALVLFSLLFDGGEPPETAGYGLQGLAAAALAAVLGATTVLLPGVRTQQEQISRALLGDPLAAEPLAGPATWRSRIRSVSWLALHFVAGFAVSLATMIGLTESALFAMAPLVSEPYTMLSDLVPFVEGIALTGSRRLLGPIIGAVLLAALVYAVAAVGAGAARLAPLFLGPSAADRLAAAQARADNLTERNSLAAELHDSIGHVLSVVALQAGAAARVIDSDPAFAREALGAIAEQARTATAELDHVLGLLRAERPAPAPRRTLEELPRLVDAVRTAGADIRFDQSGSLDAVPGVLSREMYRICQEGITNALRHGGESGPVTVELRVEDTSVRLLVTNPAPSRRPTRSGGGRGVRSMGERVRLLGGELEAGTREGEWRLAVTIPWKEG